MKDTTVHRSALVTQTAQKSGFDVKTVTTILDTLQDIVLENINNGYDSKLNGWITFKVKNIAPRKGENPKTKEKITLPGRIRVDVEVSNSFQEKIIQKDSLEKE